MSFLDDLNKAVSGAGNIVHDITGTVKDITGNVGTVVDRVGDTIGKGGGLLSVGVATPGLDASASAMTGAIDRVRVSILILGVGFLVYLIFKGGRK